MKDIKNKNKTNLDSVYWLFRLTKTAVFIMFFFCIILFLFYLIGNYQDFMDRTQLLILTVLAFASVLNSVLCTIGLVEMIFFMITDGFQFKNLMQLLLFVLIFLISLIFAAYSVIIKRFAVGV